MKMMNSAKSTSNQTCPKQVEASKNLYAELKAIREREPTKKWKIYRGEIVQINETGELVI